MILVPLHHVGDAAYMRVLPRRVEPDLIFGALIAMPIAIIHIGMALDIRLVHHIEAIAIGQVVETRIIGIMGCADRVDIVALHQPDIALH